MCVKAEGCFAAQGGFLEQLLGQVWNTAVGLHFCVVLVTTCSVEWS